MTHPAGAGGFLKHSVSLQNNNFRLNDARLHTYSVLRCYCLRPMDGRFISLQEPGVLCGSIMVLLIKCN